MSELPAEQDEQLIYGVIGAFFHVHRTLGFGFREKIYSAAMEVTLRKRGFRVQREALIRVYFEDEVIAIDKADMLVNEVLIVENKTGRLLESTSHEQLRNYLRGARMTNGLLLHFGPKARFYRHSFQHDVP
jgi:GxxExxY protein